MKDHFRFSVVYWHTFRGTGADPFGPGTMLRPWDDGSESVDNAINRVAVAFEFIEKLGAPYYAFHDRDVAPEGATLAESQQEPRCRGQGAERRTAADGNQAVVGHGQLVQQSTVHARRLDQLQCRRLRLRRFAGKEGLEVTKELGGENYVFWGGREGYQNLFNTDMKREIDHMGRFMHLAVDYAKKIGFTGQFLIEPKPKEPTKHQYDSDAAACINFLRAYDLMDSFKLNIETNHATLAGHTMMHELDYAGMQGVLGSIDANTGDMLLGWDTDQFPTDFYLTTQCMLTILKYGGLAPGGVNFDAKVRRESFEPIDLFHAHVGGMDAFARGLKIAAAIRAEGELAEFVKQRYASWDSGIGAEIESGKADFASLEKYMLDKGEIDANQSGRQEMLENLINRYL